MKKTALIFFSLSSTKQSSCKKYAKNKISNQIISQSLINNSLNSIKKTGFDVFHYDEKNQRGKNFGERFSNAFQEIFDLGYEQVISVGNDDIQINQLNWKSLEKDFTKQEVILGPTQLGGTYLIGIQKNAFKKENFQKIEWNSKKTIKSIRNSFKGFKIKNLNVHLEINSYLEFQDLKIISKLKSLANLKFLCDLLDLIIVYFQENIHFLYEINFYTSSKKRGPPLLINF